MMKKYPLIAYPMFVLAAALAFGASPRLLAQNKDEYDAKNIAPPEPPEHKIKIYFPKKLILAQKLVEEVPKRYPDVQFSLMHAPLPNGYNTVLASHDHNQIGESDRFDDPLVSGPEQYIMFHPHFADNRCSVRVPAKNASGEIIRASWAFSFPYKQGDDIPHLVARSIQIREEMAKYIPDLAALYGPAK